MSEITDKLDELERRVAEIKDWKQKYEDGKREWDRERKELLKAAEPANKLKEFLTQFLALESAAGAAKPNALKVNLEETELIVSVSHQEKEVDMTTGTVVGKILFCASTELTKDGFSEADLTEVLKEHGWNILHNTLAPTLGGLVRDGYLVKLEGSRPARYRLPGKLKLNVVPGQ